MSKTDQIAKPILILIGCILLQNCESSSTWSGLIREYYIPRWRLYYASKEKGLPFNMLEWEEMWITSPGISTTYPFEKPVEEAIELFNQLNNKR